MATAQNTLPTVEEHSTKHVGALRLAASLGAASVVIFVLCWLGTFISTANLPHAYIGLFTSADVQSVQALVEGGLWSLLFGTFSGGMIAAFYNLFASFDRR